MLGGPSPPPQMSPRGVPCPSEGLLVPSGTDPKEGASFVGDVVSLPLLCQQASMSCQRSRYYYNDPCEAV